MPQQTTSSLSVEMKDFYSDRLLMRAVPNLIHGRWGQPAILNQNTGNRFEWRKFGALNVTTTELTEGQTPASDNASVTQVFAEPLWYGAYLVHTDELEYTSFDNIVANFSDILGEQCGRSIDQLTRTEFVNNLTTNIVYPGSVSALANVTSTDIMDFSLFAESLATLMDNDVKPVEGMNYVAILHPFTWADLIQDQTVQKAFQAAADAEGTNPFRSGFVGRLLMCDIYVTSHGYVNTDAGSSNTDVYYTWFLGKEAYGVSGIAGHTPQNVDMSAPSGGALEGGLTGESVRPVEIITKGLGSAGAADPLNQRATCAWKASHDAKTLNASFAVVARHAASLGS